MPWPCTFDILLGAEVVPLFGVRLGALFISIRNRIAAASEHDLDRAPKARCFGFVYFSPQNSFFLLFFVLFSGEPVRLNYLFKGFSSSRSPVGPLFI